MASRDNVHYSKLGNRLQWGYYDEKNDSWEFAKVDQVTARKFWPCHNPRLSPHDEAIFLLNLGAEVEHSLMIQYLFAAFSLNPEQSNDQQKAKVNEWRQTILGIAREEMGHLITVQNILHAIGGPLTFRRQDFPFYSQLYPFRFMLEPLSEESLAKYVVAEMPSDDFLRNFNLPLFKEVQKIKKLAEDDNQKERINRVGVIYEEVQSILEEIHEGDFLNDSLSFQATADAWGLGDKNILIFSANNVKDAKQALHQIAEQGEGESISNKADAMPSHFERFLNIFREFPKDKDWRPSKNIAKNPSTVGSIGSPIANREALLWAQLSNQRYRMILNYLTHILQMAGSTDPNYGNLVSWCFGEMYNLRSISDILTNLPMARSSKSFAGSPFELPYNLNLPSRPQNKWRTHRDQVENSKMLIDELLKIDSPDHRAALEALLESDRKTLRIIDKLIHSPISANENK